MRKYLLFLTGLVALHSAPSAFAGNVDLNVILAGEVRPGVYGQVQIGNAPRPSVVYESPRVVVVDRHYVHEEPIYLHVPPGHARNWSRHCHGYHACGRKVYFVRSQEYEPTYVHVREHERPHHHHRDHGHKHHHKHHDHRRH